MYFSELKLAEKIGKVFYIAVTEKNTTAMSLFTSGSLLTHTTRPSTFTFICAHRLKHIFSPRLKENLRAICPQLTRKALCMEKICIGSDMSWLIGSLSNKSAVLTY